MFSSPAPTKPRHSTGRKNRSIRSPYCEAGKSAASLSSDRNTASTVQHELENTVFPREYASGSREEVYSCRPEYIVHALSGLPQELQKIMRSRDVEHLQCRGLVDSLTSFTLISLPEETFVWSYVPTAGAAQACYIFPNPVSRDGRGAPYSCFAPYQSAQEPGLILCSPTGEVRFWLSIGLGLTGGEDYQTLDLGLSVGECVVNMLRRDATSFLVSSSWGRLFRITISSSGGKRHCNAGLIFNRKHLLSRVTSTLFTTLGAPTQNNGSVSIALEPQSEPSRSIVWAASDRIVQRWAISADMWDELLSEQHVDTLFAARLSRDLLSETLPASQLQIGLHDIGIARPDAAIVLLSYNLTRQTSPSEHLTRAFCLARVEWVDNVLSVANLESLPYRSHSSDSFAKLKLFGDNGDIAFAYFKNGIIVRSLGREDGFQSMLSLKNSRNTVLAVAPPADPSLGSLIVQTLENGLLACKLNVPRIQHPGSETLVNRLRATLEQEIFFGANAENPFLFRLEPPLRGNVGLAAAQLSRDILASRIEFLTTSSSSDLRIDLAERRNRLSLLIQFINDSGALGTLSELSRQRLWLDANRLYVGQELWAHINRHSAHENQSMLELAITSVTRKLDEASGEDPVRLFFKTQLQHMDALFGELRALAESVGREHSQLRTKTMAVMECSQILLTIWGASERHRLASLDVYGMQGVVLVPLWGPDNNHIRVAQYFLEETVHCLTIVSQSSLTLEGINQRSLEARLYDLASMTLSMWDASLDFLASDPDHELDKSELDTFRENFAAARSQILGALVEWGGAETAFDLADQYHEYGFLVQLSTHPSLGGAAKTMHYLRKYREAFAFHLYKWYLENGHLAALLEPQPEFLPLVGAFFSTSHYPRLEWIHELAEPVSKFEPAVTAFETACQAEARIDTKKVLLSLAKLTSMVSSGSPDESEGDRIGIINNELDRISVQESLCKEFQATPDLSVLTTADLLSDEISQRCIAENIAKESSFKMVFQNLVKRVLNGSTLNADEIVTILSMKDTGARSNDLRIAIFLTQRHMVSDYARETIWRRCYLADSWAEFKNAWPDSILDQMLQSTHLYGCLLAMKTAGESPEGAILSPQLVLSPPLVADLSSKHPELTAAQVAELRTAYERECKDVATLIDEFGLLDWVDRLVGKLSSM